MMDILNLFSTLNDYELEDAEEDPENIKAIVASAKEADTIVYAAGVGKAKKQEFLKRQTDVLSSLKPYEKKLYCIGNEAESVKLRHPLSPIVRQWKLLKLTIAEALEYTEAEAAKNEEVTVREVPLS